MIFQRDESCSTKTTAAVRSVMLIQGQGLDLQGQGQGLRFGP